MQIKLEKVFYNNLSNIDLEINHNRITGIIGRISSGKTDLCLLLSKYVISENGFINFSSDERISLISNNLLEDMIIGNVKEFIKQKSIDFNYKVSNIEKRVLDIIKMVGLDSSILEKNLENVSRTEKIRILIAQNLLYNPDVIILDQVFEELDEVLKTKLFKLFIKLKKFYNKTIIIVANNVDTIYGFIDDLIILDMGNLVCYGDKFKVYEDDKVLNNVFIDKPTTIYFKKQLKKYKNIKLGNNDSINELIKDVYREVR